MDDSIWHLDMGASVLEGGWTRFRVWAPEIERVEVELYLWPEGLARHPMGRDNDGFWTSEVEAAAGTLYRYRLNDQYSYPDPYSRSQPEGAHGPSQVVDPAAFRWTDGGWAGVDPETLAIYELHVGTYTPEGTFDSLIRHLDALRDLGITAIELLPVAEFSGQRNWGYDGVDLFAPSSVYGGPDALRRLVDAAHARGLGVILDVVYNHLGPDGNYLSYYSPHYFTSRYETPWGEALNFDGEGSQYVRRFFVDNAVYWLREFHIDGLRLDATHQIYDESPNHVLREIADAAHERGIPGRRVLVTAEDERNLLRIILPREEGGYGLDGLWVDDFHHSVHVLLTEEERGFLKAYEGTAEEIARLLRVGFLYNEPPEGPGEAPAGVAPLVPAHHLIYCLQNHDQVGNRPFGRRLLHLVDLEPFKAAVVLLLLSPCTPLIFMGSEFASSKPFYYFTDHQGDLGKAVTEGRFAEFEDFWASRDQKRFPIPDPQSEETFLQSKLDLGERHKPRHEGVYFLYHDLLWMRRKDPVFRRQDRWRTLAEAPSPGVVAIERWVEDGERRLVAVNFGHAASLDLAAQAWLGEAADTRWRALLCTADERYAGPGCDLHALHIEPRGAVELPPRAAVAWAAR